MLANNNLIALEGGCNFRDLGGYGTVDGRAVRRGQLYRSGVLSYLTSADNALLAGLGIGAICDLRREHERWSEPTCWPDAGVDKLAWDDERDISMVSGLSGVRSAEQARAGMLALYQHMPTWLAPRLRGLFQYLAQRPVPMLFHCAAGKDRTGLAAALLLTVVGVSRETILADYLATNQAVDLEHFISHNRSGNLGLATSTHPIFSVPEAARRVLLRADPEFLAAAFASIEAGPGGMQGYLSDALGVDQGMQELLVERLLE